VNGKKRNIHSFVPSILREKIELIQISYREERRVFDESTAFVSFCAIRERVAKAILLLRV
jgi:hypothetical protein